MYLIQVFSLWITFPEPPGGGSLCVPPPPPWGPASSHLHGSVPELLENNAPPAWNETAGSPDMGWNKCGQAGRRIMFPQPLYPLLPFLVYRKVRRGPSPHPQPSLLRDADKEVDGLS